MKTFDTCNTYAPARNSDHGGAKDFRTRQYQYNYDLCKSIRRGYQNVTHEICNLES